MENSIYTNTFSKENVIRAFNDCAENTSWKPSVAHLGNKTTLSSLMLYENLKNKTFEPSNEFNNFTINERGKLRDISAPKYLDRVFQKCLCDNYLVDKLRKSLIENNFACLKGKGVNYARERFARDLERCLLMTSEKAIYVLIVDFRKYFYSINHEILKFRLSKIIEDEDIKEILFKTIDTFGEKGLGLGSQVSQILSVYFANAFDHYIVNYKHFKYFGRYMDDSYIIYDDLKTLKELISEIRYFCKKFLDLDLSENKIKITKIYKSNQKSNVVFIKCRYTVLNGKIISTEHSDPKFFKREARRLFSFKEKLINGYLDISEIEKLYKSWRFGVLNSFTNPTKVFFMDIRYINTFGSDSFLNTVKTKKYYKNDFTKNKSILKWLLYNSNIRIILKQSYEAMKVINYVKSTF